MKKNIIGILYFFIHFIIEVTSFYIVSYYSTTTVAWILALAYDFFAFVPQGFFGFLKDKGFTINFAIVGMICSFVSLLLLYFDAFPAIVILLAGLGNAMIHIEGAYDSLASSKGKMSPSAIFVAGGFFWGYYWTTSCNVSYSYFLCFVFASFDDYSTSFCA